MKGADSVKPAERMRPHQRQYPWWIVFIVGLLFAFGLAQAISDWGEREPLVSWAIEKSCGL